MADPGARFKGTETAVRRTVRGAAKGSLGHLGLETNQRLLRTPQEHTPSRLGEAQLPRSHLLRRYAIAPCVIHQQCAWATGQPYLVSAVAPSAVNHP